MWTWQGQGKKAKQLKFTPGLTKWWDSSKLMSSDDMWWIMMMILIYHDELFTKHRAVLPFFQYSAIQDPPTPLLQSSWTGSLSEPTLKPFSSLVSMVSNTEPLLRRVLVTETVVMKSYAGILEQSMGARNRAGIGLSYRSARLHKLANSIPWNQFLASIKV